MALTYGAKERQHRKRLLIASPIAALIVGTLFVTSDVVPYEEIEKHFGWEGETHVLPEISILPDNDLFEALETTELESVTSEEESALDETGPEEGGILRERPIEETNQVYPEAEQALVRRYDSHTDVPYSEDFVILHMVRPEYPPGELLRGIEGEVIVEIFVNDNGMVENAWVLTALGPRTFEAASLEAVRQFRFKPPKQAGVPQPMWIRFQIRFRLVS